jgi:hypothetical protein
MEQGAIVKNQVDGPPTSLSDFRVRPASREPRRVPNREGLEEDRTLLVLPESGFGEDHAALELNPTTCG